MASLPTVSGSTNIWGTQLNNWLLVGHNADGSTAGQITVQGADSTGVNDSSTAIAAAFTSLGTSPGTIFLPPGTYKDSGGHVLGVQQNFISPGATINHTGNNTWLHQYDSAFNIGSTSPTVSLGGYVSGFIVDGTNAGANAIGFVCGDINSPKSSVSAQNYSAAGQLGIVVDSLVGWTNWGVFDFNTSNCTTGVLARNTSGLNVIGGASVNIKTLCNPNQTGLAFQGGSRFFACPVFNFSLNNKCGTSDTGKGIDFGNTGAGILESIININMEADAGAGNVGPVPINAGGSFNFYGNIGVIRIYSSSPAAYKQTSGLEFTYQFSFNGIMDCNTSGDFLANTRGLGFSAILMGGVLEAGSQTVYAAVGDGIYNAEGNTFKITLANGANTISFKNIIAGYAQKIVLHVKQPASGAAGTLTITGAATTVGSGVVTLSSTNGYEDVCDVWTPDGVSTYASVRGLNYH